MLFCIVSTGTVSFVSRTEKMLKTIVRAVMLEIFRRHTPSDQKSSETSAICQ